MPTMRPRITHLVAGLLLLAFSFASLETGAATPGNSGGRAEIATQTLFEAVHTNDFAAAEAAIAAGANVDAKNRWNLTPIELAIDKGYFRIAHFLVSVRNSRSAADEQAAAENPAATKRAAAKSPVQARAQQPATGRPTSTDFAPQPWPSNKPNPFDPETPAFGAGLPVIDGSRSSTVLDTGDLLATDTPARSSREYRN